MWILIITLAFSNVQGVYKGGAGGDWEKDVNFILYLDPNDKIRAYVPSKGNMYCHNCKCAWGTCECGATEPDYDKVDHDFAMMYADICNRILTM